MPFLMSVLPSKTIWTPSPCSRNSTSGNAAPPWETRIAGPVSGAFRTGVCAVAVPTNDPSGHPAGLALNCASVHAFCSVVSREGSDIGSCRLTLLMFASPGFWAILTVRLAPLALLVWPWVEAANDGLNGRLAQFAAWNGFETPALAPLVEPIVPVTDSGEQLVGLNMKPDLSIVTLTVRRSSGMPCR